MLETALEEINREIAVAETRLETLRREKVGAEALLTRVRRLTRAPGRAVATTRTTGQAAGTISNLVVVSEIMAEANRALHLREIESLSAARGRALNSDQVRSAVTYLKRKGRAERASRGMWRLVDPTNAETPAVTGVSEAPTSTSEEGGDSHETPQTSPAEGYVHPQLGAPVAGAD